GDRRFAAALFDGMRGMGRLFQGAATVDSILRGDIAERAADAGLRSLFVSFVFGMDDDDDTVFERTVEWGIEHGLTTATYHIQTPYPGTRLFARMEAAGRIVTRDWDLYDTRHVVYRPARLT